MVTVKPFTVNCLLNKRKSYKKGKYVLDLIECFNIKRVVITKKGESVMAQIQIKGRYGIKKYEVPFDSGFLAAQMLQIPMAIEKDTLRTEGVYINKEMLTGSLVKGAF
jgi:hypothetical protein